MDINHSTLERNLIPMLEALCEAHFVSLDLELSGIAYNKTSNRKNQENRAVGKPTLQERYEDVKEAAEKYQVLQVGFTITKEDRKQNLYYMRPYNMFLSPLIKDDQIDIQRDFTFQNHATNFLLSKGFNIEGPFKDGVPYLSMDEEKEALSREDWKANKDNIPSIIPSIHDSQMKSFMAMVRQRIEQWQAAMPANALMIGPGTPVLGGTVLAKLTAFQRRVVHELVRGEYPGLSTGSAGAFVSVFPRDEGRERAARNSRVELFKRRLQKQKGISWFVEALARGQLEPANPANWASMEDGKPVWVEPAVVKDHFNDLRMVLQRRKVVLAGHNVFVDLVFFYKTFVGKLPDKVEQFATAIHHLFPRVVDTKYMAAYGEDVVPADSGLVDVYDNFGLLPFPLIEVDQAHSKYSHSQHAHEAGWDAYATAAVLVRFSAIIARTAQAAQEPPAATATADDDNDDDSKEEPSPLPRPSSPVQPYILDKYLAEQGAGPPPSPPVDPTEDLICFSPPESPKPSEAKFVPIMSAAGADTGAGAGAGTGAGAGAKAGGAGVGLGSDNELFMPPFSSDMWEVYGNKLLINGTQEGELYLGKWSDGAPLMEF